MTKPVILKSLGRIQGLTSLQARPTGIFAEGVFTTRSGLAATARFGRIDSLGRVGADPMLPHLDDLSLSSGLSDLDIGRSAAKRLSRLGSGQQGLIGAGLFGSLADRLITPPDLSGVLVDQSVETSIKVYVDSGGSIVVNGRERLNTVQLELSPADQGVDVKNNGNNNWREILYVIKESRRLKGKLTLLMHSGVLSLNETLLVRHILDPRTYDLDVPEKARPVVIQRLCQRLRVEFDDDFVFDDIEFALDSSHLPHSSEQALRSVRQILEGEYNVKCRKTLAQMMPSVEELAEFYSIDLDARKYPPAGRLFYLFRRVFGYKAAQIAAAINLSPSATSHMLRVSTYRKRDAFPHLLRMANLLGIPGEWALALSFPELAQINMPVLKAESDLFVGFMAVKYPIKQIKAFFDSTDAEFKSQILREIFDFYICQIGNPLVRELVSIRNNVILGRRVSIGAISRLAEAIKMPPLLAVLLAKPELLPFFDIVDLQGNVLNESGKDYSRIVLVLSEDTEGFGTVLRRDARALYLQLTAASDIQGRRLPRYGRHLCDRFDPVFTDTFLGEYALTTDDLLSLLDGQIVFDKDIIKFVKLFQLNSLETARFFCECVIARSKVCGREKYIRARSMLSRLNMLAVNDNINLPAMSETMEFVAEIMRKVNLLNIDVLERSELALTLQGRKEKYSDYIDRLNEILGIEN